MIFTLLLFFVYAWCFGYSVTFFLKSSEDFIEKNTLRLGIGLGVLTFLGVVLNLFKVPLDWRIFLFLCVIIPVYSFIKFLIKSKGEYHFPHFNLNKSMLYFILVLVMFFVTFYMYEKGAFAYPWLEDGDPYHYATTVEYINHFKTFSKADNIKELWVAQYMEPYTVAYNIPMALLAQTNPSINYVLKFFNALIISLSIPLFYFLVRKITKDRKKALFATFILFVIPCFKGHFIFAEQLTTMLFFPIFYSFENIKEDKRWFIVAGILIATVLFTQFSSAGVLGMIFIPLYWLVKAITEKNIQKYVIFGVLLGVVLSLFYWAPMLIKYGPAKTNPIEGTDQTVFKSGTSYINPLSDFFFAKDVWPNQGSGNKIDAPVGIGIPLAILIILGLMLVIYNLTNNYKSLFSIDNQFVLWGFLLVIVNFFNTYGNPIFTINPHRGWSFLAIGIAIFSVYPFFYLLSLFKNKMIKLAIIITVGILLLTTSFASKYTVNTAMWPQHLVNPYYEWPAYSYVQQLPANTAVTSLCRDDYAVIGLDKYSSSHWDSEMLSMKSVLINKTNDEIYNLLKTKKYEYFIYDLGCFEKFGQDNSINQLQTMLNYTKFVALYQSQFQGERLPVFVFRIV